MICLTEAFSLMIKQKKFATIAFVACLLLLWTPYRTIRFYEEAPFDDYKASNDFVMKSKKFLVSSSECHIPDLDPFNEETKSFFYPEKYVPCSNRTPLTFFVSNDGEKAVLGIDERSIEFYSKTGLYCCFSVVERDSKGDDPDRRIR